MHKYTYLSILNSFFCKIHLHYIAIIMQIDSFKCDPIVCVHDAKLICCAFIYIYTFTN